MADSAAGKLVPAVQTLDRVLGHGALASPTEHLVSPSQLPDGKPPDVSLPSRPENTPVLIQCNIPAWWKVTLLGFLCHFCQLHYPGIKTFKMSNL